MFCISAEAVEAVSSAATAAAADFRESSSAAPKSVDKQTWIRDDTKRCSEVDLVINQAPGAPLPSAFGCRVCRNPQFNVGVSFSNSNYGDLCELKMVTSEKNSRNGEI
ncbi:hypothetical protein SOVF_115530 [Spinacia oleracea]|nr:hypothetical protein SOVF_115530 [Spinacia oleracea]